VWQDAPVNILCIASEVAPYAKTGGLADVMGALPRELSRNGHDVRVFMPLYDRIDTTRLDLSVVAEHVPLRLGAHAYDLKVFAAGDSPRMYFVHCPALYARGSLYTNDPDEHRRFMALCYVALATCQQQAFAPQVVQCNDWQTALVPLLLKTRFAWDRLFARARTLLTIHNLNYQGSFPSSVLAELNLEHEAHHLHQDLLRAGRINFLLHGILYADGVSTVSPTYAQEIQTPEHGAGLDPFLRARRSTVVGILNGVDYDEWSPEADAHVPARFSARDLTGKAVNRTALRAAFGLPQPHDVPLFGVVSRFVSQKGLDLVADVMPEVFEHDAGQLVVLGSGEARLEETFFRLQRAYPRHVGFHRGFSNPLAHLIEAGADAFLMPSRYEPCGLNQMYSLRYGTVPIVHRTGGLADTVVPWDARTGQGTGFVFEHPDATGLGWAVGQTLRTFRDRAAWHRLMMNGMSQDFSWRRQARIYEQLFARLEP
jgi:starch synthase